MAEESNSPPAEGESSPSSELSSSPAEDSKATPSEAMEQQSNDLISKANEAVERMEKANAETAKLLARQEALAVERTLGGKTAAGSAPKEETPEDYAKKALRGDLDVKK